MPYQWMKDPKVLIFAPLMLVLVFAISCGGFKDVPEQVIEKAKDIKEILVNDTPVVPAQTQDPAEPFQFKYCVYLANASDSEMGIEATDMICLLCHADFISATDGMCPGVLGQPAVIEIMDQNKRRRISLILKAWNCINCPKEGKKFNFAGY